MPKITIELSEEESEFFRTGCILRVTKHAANLLEQPETDDHEDPDAPWVAADLRKIGETMESVRHKIVEAIFTEQVSR